MPSMRPADFQGLVSGGTDYSFFGALVAVWVLKGFLLCLSGPEQLYDFQRFLAAKDERDASKLGALWGVIHTVRWPFAMAIAVMAIMGIGNAALDAKLRADPETALPLIIGSMLPDRPGRLHVGGSAVGIFGDIQFDRQRRCGLSRQGRLSAIYKPGRRRRKPSSASAIFHRRFLLSSGLLSLSSAPRSTPRFCGSLARSRPASCRRTFFAGIGGG